MGSRNVFRICFRGTYSCNWKHSDRKTQRCTCCWFFFLGLVSVIALAWLYVCFAAYNDHTDVNWKAFGKLRIWVNWYIGGIILFAVLAIYCLLLLIISLLLFAIKEPLDLHWLHKVLLSVGLLLVVTGIVLLSCEWTAEWKVVWFSLQATMPFLHLAAVAALTMISWFVFQKCHRAPCSVTKIILIGVLVAISLVVFLCPFYIHSPCISTKTPLKPALVAHRGAPVLAPENTMMSFRRSIECNVTAFETDVQFSKDMVPFLMHDSGEGFLYRTTNVKTVFPNREFNNSSDITWEELQMLNTGDWFVKTDPFWSLSLLSEEDKAVARNQTVPSLSELLELSKAHGIALMFDIKNEGHSNWTDIIVKVIQDSGISDNLIWWLHSGHRNSVKNKVSRFQQVYPDRSTLQSDTGARLNMNYTALSAEEISDLQKNNVSVNLWVVNERWLFSLLWCTEVNSVTTNNCHVFKNMSQPDWHLTPLMYRVIWITADVLSLILMFIFFLYQRKKQERTQNIFLESDRRIPLLRI